MYGDDYYKHPRDIETAVGILKEWASPPPPRWAFTALLLFFVFESSLITLIAQNLLRRVKYRL